MAKFDIKTVKPKFVVTTSPDNKIDVVVNKPIIETKLSRSFFKLKNTGGPRGLKGEQGEPGQDATIEVVSTTTGAAGTNASVVNQGTASAAQLAFTIPRGDKGETGAAGAPGQDGQSATIEVASTSTLPAGSSATVTNVGSSSQARLAFGIPKGDKGDTGAAGADGDAATIQIGQVETLLPSQQAYVVNVGSTSQAIFDIGIPKGDKGDSGSGSGDMLASTYDPNGDVASAGGIPDYVSSQLPTVNDATLTIQKNGTTVQTFTANQGSDATANITVPTDTSDLTNGAGYITSSSLPGDMTGATSSTAGAHGLVPAPAAGDQDKVLKGDGTWGNAAATAIVAYINGAYSGSWTSSFQVYTTSAYTTVCPFQDIDDSIKAGVAVTFRTSDNYDITITGLLGTVSTTHYYTALYDGYTLGTLTYSESNSRWAYTAGTPINNGTLTIQKNGTDIQTFTANQSSNATANITVPTQFSDLTGTIGTSQIENSAVTSSKIAPSVLEFQPGDTWAVSWNSNYWVGRQRIVGTTKQIDFTIVLPKNISTSVSSVTFAPSNYNEAFGGSGVIFSINNPTSSQLSYSCVKSNNVCTLNMTVTILASATLTHNAVCCVDISGTFTFS